MIALKQKKYSAIYLAEKEESRIFATE